MRRTVRRYVAFRCGGGATYDEIGLAVLGFAGTPAASDERALLTRSIARAAS
jgi:hypothetical protein